MPQLNYQWIHFEAFDKFIQVSALVQVVFERPGKLNQNRAELAGFRNRIDTFAKRFFIFNSGLPALMRKPFVELSSEDEVRIVLDATQPRARGRTRRRIIEDAVYLRGVKGFRDHGQRI